MSTTGTTTIGINLGSRYVGIAVIVDAELREWRLRILRGKTLIEKFQRLTSILARLVDSYSPNSVVLKKIRPARSSPMLNHLQLEAKAFLQQNAVTVHEYTLNQIKMRVIPGKQVNKTKLAEYIVAQYPILFEEWEREISSKRHYRTVVFEAIALSRAWSSQMNT